MLDPTARTAPPEYVYIGRCGRAFQVAGAFRLQLDAPAEEYLALGTPLFITGLGRCEIREIKHANGRLSIAVTGVRNRTQATALLHEHVHISTTGWSEADVEFLAADIDDELLGLPVVVAGETVGTISATHFTEAYDYIEATLTAGNTVLLPLEAPYVELTSEALVLTDPPPGLLND